LLQSEQFNSKGVSMKRQVWALGMILAVGLVLAACSANEPQSTQVSTSGGAAPVSPQIGCTAENVVQSLRRDFPTDEASISHHRVLDVTALEVWFVDPELDPGAIGDAIQTQAQLATDQAIMATSWILRSQSCASELFERINVTVVDRDYQLRFSGTAGFRELAAAHEPSGEHLERMVETFTIEALSSDTATRTSASTPPEACTWSEARSWWISQFDIDLSTVAFYVLVDGQGTDVWAQWQGPNPRLVSGPFLSGLIDVGSQLGCLYPPLDTMWVVYVDWEGTAQTVGRLMGSALDPADPRSIIEGFETLYP
jgi:hypothetical protein